MEENLITGHNAPGCEAELPSLLIGNMGCEQWTASNAYMMSTEMLFVYISVSLPVRHCVCAQLVCTHLTMKCGLWSSVLNDPLTRERMSCGPYLYFHHGCAVPEQTLALFCRHLAVQTSYPHDILSKKKKKKK